MLQPADIWCAKVLNYEQLMRETGYKMLNMELKVRTSNGLSIKTTRCPIRIDGQMVLSETGAPLLGEHNERIDAEFGLMG
jgi:crotonobetainyl-CoA:carnitine CoA-transferase CaiB-like acyl-CoA transferase